MGLVVHLNPFRETLGISRPTHFTDVETEGQSGETHGHSQVFRLPCCVFFPEHIWAETVVWSTALGETDRAGSGEDPHVARCVEQAPLQPGVQANPS